MTRNTTQPSKLTYQRLITKLQQLTTELAGQYPDAKDTPRVQALRDAIETGISTAQAGLGGDTSVATAGRLKHEITAEIQGVHERFDAAAKIIKYAGMGRKNMIEAYNGPEESETEAGSDATITETNAGVEAEQPPTSPSMQDAAAILQSLSSPKRKRDPEVITLSSSSSGQHTPTSDGPSFPPKRAKYDYIPVPPSTSFDNMTAEQIFFMGVEYGIQNALNEAQSKFGPKGHFRNYVMAQLGLELDEE